jgi:glycosyltransferase involved in cell wall biosynthesis
MMNVRMHKILYFVAEDWYFCSHRLALATAVQSEGFAVSVLTRVKQHAKFIKNADINLIPINMVRGGINPFCEIKVLRQIWRIYSREKPVLVHHVALKPVLYGSFVAMFMPDLKVVNLIAGLGAIFSSTNWKTLLLKPVVMQLFRIFFRRVNSVTIVQNHDDFNLLSKKLGIPPSKLKLIKGSGVDVEQFKFSSFLVDEVNVALVSRLLSAKGIGEYIAAVKLLKQKGLVFNAFLVGEPDDENIASISSKQLQEWNDEGFVSCVGRIDDVAQFWQKMHIGVLPSYYAEGIPKCLIEAASCGLPIVTTNTPGCNDIVADGINGILVPPRAIIELANAIEFLILNKDLREKMGLEGRRRVIFEFSNDVILSQTLDVYREMV